MEFFRKKPYFFLLFLMLLLQGCMNAAVTGAQAVYNRHHLKKNLDDQYITMQAYQAIYVNHQEYKETHVAIDTFNNQVLLTGQVSNEDQQKEIEALVKDIPGIEKVYNFTSLSGPSSSLSRISDTWITTKVKSKLIASNDIDPSLIKVVTENGTVYLMGILPKDQAETAVDIAENTDGVQGVVKIFSYLTISKT